MKNNKTTLAVVGAVVMGLTGMAHAGSVGDTGSVTVNVEATCEMVPNADKTIDLSGGAVSGQLGFTVMVRCSADLPYILENDTAQGSVLQVVETTTNRTYDVLFRQDGNYYWGSNANGEALSSVGTGQYQAHSMFMSFNLDGAYGRPQNGVYVGELTTSLSF